MNLGNIRTFGRQLISQEDTGNTDFTDSELNGFANEGTRFMAAVAKYPRKQTSSAAVDGTATYALPSDFVLLLNAYFGDISVAGDVRPLKIVTEDELRNIRPSWMDASAGTKGNPEFLMLKDRTNFLINPRPDASQALSGKTIILVHVYTPATLSSDSDTPELPTTFHDLIPKYIQYMCYLGKLNKPDLAAALLKNIVEQAKVLEQVAVKESDRLSMYWDSPDDKQGLQDGGDFGIVFE